MVKFTDFATEGLFGSMSYSMASDKTIAVVIKSIPELLKNLTDEQISGIKVDASMYSKDILGMYIKFFPIFIRESKKIVEIWKQVEHLYYDENGDHDEEAAALREKMIKEMNSAAKRIDASTGFKKLYSSLEVHEDGKYTLGDLGFTKSNLKTLSIEFLNKVKIPSTKSEFEEFSASIRDAVSEATGDGDDAETIELYDSMTKAVTGFDGIRRPDKFLYMLGKKLGEMR